MFKKILLPIWFVVGLVFVACQSQPPTPPPAGSPVAQLPTTTFTAVPPTPTITNTPDRVATALAQPTHTPRPTITPSPTFTPSPTNTPFPTVVPSTPVWFSATPAPANTAEELQLGLQQAFGGAVTEVTVSGLTVYVAAGVNLIALDLQNPAAPQELARYFQPNISALASYEQFIYVAWQQEITIFEYTAKELKPTTVTLAVPFVVENLEVQDGQLWATACNQTTECQNEIYDLTNPVDPQPTTSVVTPNLSAPNYPYTLTVMFNDTRFEFDGLSLSSYDSNNTLLKQSPIGFNPSIVTLVDSYLFFEGAYCEGGCSFWLDVVDLHQPNRLPTVLSINDEVSDWFQTADYLYFATDNSLVVVDTQGILKVVGEWQSAGTATQLEVEAPYVYEYNNGRVTQFHMSQGGVWNKRFRAGAVIELQSDDGQFFASDDLTLLHYDPYADIVNEIPLAYIYGGVGFAVVHEGLIYHSYMGERETIWRTSQVNSSEITEISEQPLEELVFFESGLWHNNYVWAYSSDTLYGIDVSDPAGITWPAPSLVLDHAPCDMVAVGDYLYLILSEVNCNQQFPNYPRSLVVVDISQSQPTLVFTQPLSNTTYRLAVDEQFLYLAAGDLLLFSLENPAEPTLAYTVNTPGFVTDVQLQEDSIWVAAGASGILHFTKP